ncbi:MAG TPA: hypothetical protein VK348_12045 [Planctomycetota bacterium]|nr:hypothetical protein [Planctomycetota bacterium]
MLCLGAALAWLVVRVPFMVEDQAMRTAGGRPGGVPPTPALADYTAWTGRTYVFPVSSRPAWAEASAALQQPAAKLIKDALGITPEMVSFLRGLPREAPVVLFSPYKTLELTLKLHDTVEGVKNLVYPQPRDFSYAQDAAALQPLLIAANENRLVVMDYTQGEQPLPGPAEFELVARGLFMRFWRLVKVPR